MTPAELLKHSNEIYLGFLERYLGSEKGDFPVPEFKTVQVEMLGHLENLRSTAPDQPSPATRIRKPLARPTDEELKTDHLRTIWNRDLPQINEEAARFNSTLSKQCIQNRIEKWKELADPVETPKLTYRAFWRQYWVFADIISKPCAEDFSPDFKTYANFEAACFFPGFCLPVLLEDSRFEEFNALGHLPLFLIGSIFDSANIDHLPMRPRRFIEHDVDHAIASMLYVGWITDFLTSDAKSRIQSSMGSGDWLFSFFKDEDSVPLVKRSVRPLSEIKGILESRRSQNFCIHTVIHAQKNAAQLAESFFQATHEEALQPVDRVGFGQKPKSPPRWITKMGLEKEYSDCMTLQRGE